MAFVSQSPRTLNLKHPIASLTKVGPGNYNVEQAAVALLAKSPSQNKKLPPFGTSEDRNLSIKRNTNNDKDKEKDKASDKTPGPGAYLAQPEFVNITYSKELDDNNTYIIKDNGHINQRTQQYAFQSNQKRDSSLMKMLPQDNPGPGTYQINDSSFTGFKGSQQTRKIYHQPSPKGIAFMNMSIPTIPSRYLQPNLEMFENGEVDFNGTQNFDNSFERLLNPKVKRLTEDSSRLGPGCYEVQDTLLKKSPKGLIDFSTSKTNRDESKFVLKTTQPSVGPGSYEITKEINRKIQNPTVPRDTNRSTLAGGQIRRKNKGSIRDNFDEDSDSEDSEMDQSQRTRNKIDVPGPGSYLKQEHISQFAKNSQRPEHFQFFGSAVERFKTPGNIANALHLGPGTYNTENVVRSVRLTTFQAAGSSSFLGSIRRNTGIENNELAKLPGPADYRSEQSIQFLKEKRAGKHSFAFHSKVDRFKTNDESLVGPGQYKVPGAISPREANMPMASYRSNTIRELKFQIDKNVPGIGVYNPQDFSSIGISKIQGGAPNNFSLLAKKNLGARHQTQSLNRAIYSETSSKDQYYASIRKSIKLCLNLPQFPQQMWDQEHTEAIKARFPWKQSHP